MKEDFEVGDIQITKAITQLSHVTFTVYSQLVSVKLSGRAAPVVR